MGPIQHELVINILQFPHEVTCLFFLIDELHLKSLLGILTFTFRYRFKLETTFCDSQLILCLLRWNLNITELSSFK